MGITHERVIVAGDRGNHADWNANHIISDDLMPKSQATRIVAAYNSVDKTRADYTCNGINDDIEIQAAIDSLPAQGGSVYLKEGNYAINSTILIKVDNTAVLGSGHGTLIQTALNINLFDTNGKNSFLIEKMGLKTTYGTPTNAGVYVNSSDHSMVLNMWFESLKYGIKLSASSYNLIDPVAFGSIAGGYASGSAGVYMNGNSNYNVIISIISLGAIDSGLEIVNSDFNIISNCVISGADIGISIDSNSDSNIILGNVVRNNTTNNILNNGTNTDVGHNITA